MFTQALSSLGTGKGKRAARFRGDARRAMENCYSAVPCWIMPTWRISEHLPAEIGSFDLVIVDEASQSSIEALPALMRGKAAADRGRRQTSQPNGGLRRGEKNPATPSQLPEGAAFCAVASTRMLSLCLG